MQSIQTKSLAAVLYVLMAMFVIGFIDNFISQLAVHIGVWQFLFLRLLLSVPLLILAARFGFGSLLPINWVKVVLRSLLVATAMILYFGALAFLTIGEALAGLFTSPIFILLFSVLIFHERIGVWRLLAVTFGFTGVLLVLQVGGSEFSWIMLMPLGGGVLYALGNLVTRHWCSKESTLVLVAGIFMMQGILALFALFVLELLDLEVTTGTDGFLLRGWVWSPHPDIWIIMFMQVIGSLFGVFCLIRAYQWGEASVVSVFEYSVLIFGPAFAYMLFGHTLDGLQLAGIALITLAGATIALRSRTDTTNLRT